MKSVLISIKPKYCSLIANGKKTIEIRKTRPKLETPFRCYIYCTKDKPAMGKWLDFDNNNHITTMQDDDFDYYNKNTVKKINGKVIGEFVCSQIKEYQTEFYESDDEFYEDIREIWDNEDYEYDVDKEFRIIASNDRGNLADNEILRQSKLTIDELKKYVGSGFSKFFSWRISNLKIYDKPKNLNEFSSTNCHRGIQKYNCEGCWDCVLTKPPQSWQYIER